MVDGIATEFLGTAAAYSKRPCSDLNLNLSYTVLPTDAGSLIKLAYPGALPPALLLAPVLEASNVLDLPLPPVTASGPPAPTPPISSDSSNVMSAMVFWWLPLLPSCH